MVYIDNLNPTIVNKMFSIIVPVYNAGKCLKDCLDSVCAQTFDDWECICVDDGSTDYSGAVLDEYSKRDSRFVVIHQENRGEGAARNAGLEISRGDWLAYVDSDDLVAPSLLADVADAINKYPNADLVRFRCIQFKECGTPQFESDLKPKVTLADFSSKLPDETANYGVIELAYKRSKFGDIRFGSLKIGADIVYTSKCLSVAQFVASFDKVEYGYRQLTSSMSHKHRDSRMLFDDIDFRVQQAGNLAASGKKLGDALGRGRANGLIEMVPYELITAKGVDNIDFLWSKWFAALEDVSRFTFLTSWQKMVCRILPVTHSKLLVYLLCIFPHILKRMGVHR